MSETTAYVVAARRAANGRIGGLHRSRRIEDLAAPIVEAALKDACIEAVDVDEIIIGNASAGGNPARLIALAAGLPGEVPAYSLDRQCASGLDAILSAIRQIQAGEADVVVAGGAESLSTAPWRVAKPRNLYQLPRFLDFNPGQTSGDSEPQRIAASQALADRRNIDRDRQDAYALRSHERAERARREKRFVGELVAIRIAPEEARDESLAAPASRAELGDLPPYMTPGGTVTPGNASLMHDGAAIAVVVSERVYGELGRPAALKLVASVATGVGAEQQGLASLAAMQKLYGRLNGFDRSAITVIEAGESSAAEIIALEDELGLGDGIVNPDGGAIAIGHPFGATGAMLVTRLFSDMVRHPKAKPPAYGVVTIGAIGGVGRAALFERVEGA